MIDFSDLEVGKKYIVGLDLADGYCEKACVIIDLNSQGLQYVKLEDGSKTVVTTNRILRKVKK